RCQGDQEPGSHGLSSIGSVPPGSAAECWLSAPSGFVRSCGWPGSECKPRGAWSPDLCIGGSRPPMISGRGDNPRLARNGQLLRMLFAIPEALDKVFDFGLLLAAASYSLVLKRHCPSPPRRIG